MESELATENTTTTKTKKSGTPPAKPGESSDSSSTTGEMPSGEAPEEMDGEMPEMCDEDDEDCEMPEMPSDMSEGGPGGDGGPGGMMQDASSGSTWHPAAYLAIGAGSVVLSIAIMYACFSNFFHKKPAQTFDKWQKFLIFCTAALVLAAGICVLCYFIPEWTS